MVSVDYMQGRSTWKLCSLADVEKYRTEEDFFITWQRYCNDKHGEYGEIYGNWPFDFDHELDISIAQKDCIKVYETLIGRGVYVENILLFFSGNKGFHLEIDYRSYMDNPFFDLHLIYKEFYKYLEKVIKPEKNKSTMDASIYSIRRMWRYPNTRHSKTGLYCIPITFNELKLPYKEIFKLAQGPRNISIPSFKEDPQMKFFFQESKSAYWKSCQDFDKRKDLIRSYIGDYPPCVRKIFTEGIPHGSKNNVLYLLVRFLKDFKTEDEIYKIILDFFKKTYDGSQGYDQKETMVRSTINSAIRRKGSFVSCSSFYPWCEKEQCNTFINKKSKKYIEIVNNKFNIYTYKQAVDLLEIDLKNGNLSRVMKSGIGQLDSKTMILKDSIVAVGSLSDVGKTSFAITIAKNNQEKKILYLAIEEGRNRAALRLINARIKETSQIKIVTGAMGSITPKDIYALCQTHSGQYDFMIIDQLSNLSEAGKEERFKYKAMMEKFREIAREFEKPIFILHQLGRAAMKEDEPKKEHFAEGADIERLSYDVWLLYRRRVDGVLYNLLKIDKNKNYKKEINVPLTYDVDTCTFKDYEVFDIDWNFFEKKLNIDKNEYFFGKVDETIEFTRCK